MTKDKDLEWMPIHVLAGAIAAGTLRPEAVMERCLDRIARLDPKLHAFTEVYAADARRAAEAAATLLRSGYSLGPLHGIPIAVKDLCDIAGRAIGCGSKTWEGRISPADGAVAQRLLRAGAIMIGKTHLVEFAFGAWGTNASLGTPWNPWDLETARVPGGSSSGSGVAVAAGMAPAAIGSDTGGSVRIPAAMCGIVGLKTTVGRISRAGAVPLSFTLDSIGPMTRSVEDAALVYRALSGPDPADPTTIGIPADDPLARLRDGAAGMRLGVLPESERRQLDPAVAQAYAEAIRVFERLGAHIVDRPISGAMAEGVSRTGMFIATEAYAYHRETIAKEGARLDPNVLRRLQGGRNVSAADYIALIENRRKAQQGFAAQMDGLEAVLTPTTPIPAIPLREVDETATPLSSYTRALNYLGLCGLALPCGFSPDGLPLSLQIVGRAFAEETILRLGWAFEQATDWHTRHPAL